jgi:hypothetical protein
VQQNKKDYQKVCAMIDSNFVKFRDFHKPSYRSFPDIISSVRIGPLLSYDCKNQKLADADAEMVEQQKLEVGTTCFPGPSSELSRLHN